jgi:exopolyphosphatase/guanosine-5'-triphosphate,3'-diphosphate pyrophosphatase
MVVKGPVRNRDERTTGALMPGRRVAAIDCGTNSIRLLIADLDPSRSSLTDLVRRMEIVRLGEGVDKTGRLAEPAIERTITALRGYAAQVRARGAEAVRMVATSASRDAANADEFTRRVKEVLGVAPEVVTGDEEAALSFTGATRELVGGADIPFLVTDIGGGSTEFVVGTGASTAAPHLSVNIGCVRLTERFLHSDPPLTAEIAATTGDIDAALDQVAARVPVTEARTLVGLAGSVTTIAAIALNLDHYDSESVYHSRVTATRVHEIAERLLAQTRAERAAIPVMHPGRVDVIGAGALILDRIMTRFGFAEVFVSEHDILDGIAWSLVA